MQPEKGAFNHPETKHSTPRPSAESSRPWSEDDEDDFKYKRDRIWLVLGYPAAVRAIEAFGMPTPEQVAIVASRFPKEPWEDEYEQSDIDLCHYLGYCDALLEFQACVRYGNEKGWPKHENEGVSV